LYGCDCATEARYLINATTRKNEHILFFIRSNEMIDVLNCRIICKGQLV